MIPEYHGLTGSESIDLILFVLMCLAPIALLCLFGWAMSRFVLCKLSDRGWWILNAILFFACAVGFVVGAWEVISVIFS